MTTLKPCPFCGEKDELYPGYRPINGDISNLEKVPYDIDCLGCGITFTPRKGVDAREAWNRRAGVEPGSTARAEAA